MIEEQEIKSRLSYLEQRNKKHDAWRNSMNAKFSELKQIVEQVNHKKSRGNSINLGTIVDMKEQNELSMERLDEMAKSVNWVYENFKKLVNDVEKLKSLEREFNLRLKNANISDKKLKRKTEIVVKLPVGNEKMKGICRQRFCEETPVHYYISKDYPYKKVEYCGNHGFGKKMADNNNWIHKRCE